MYMHYPKSFNIPEKVVCFQILHIKLKFYPILKPQNKNICNKAKYVLHFQSLCKNFCFFLSILPLPELQHHKLSPWLHQLWPLTYIVQKHISKHFGKISHILSIKGTGLKSQPWHGRVEQIFLQPLLHPTQV